MITQVLLMYFYLRFSATASTYGNTSVAVNIPEPSDRSTPWIASQCPVMQYQDVSVTIMDSVLLLTALVNIAASCKTWDPDTQSRQPSLFIHPTSFDVSHSQSFLPSAL